MSTAGTKSGLVIGVAPLVLLVACSPSALRGGTSTSGVAPQGQARADRTNTPGRWTLVYAEGFGSLQLPQASWQLDAHDERGRYVDDGAYFKERDARFRPPKAYRARAALGKDGWFSYQLYSRRRKALASFLAVEADPAGGGNKVLRLRTEEHTDGAVLRSTEALPPAYKICVKVGYADYGTGRPGLNGYDGGERATPWVQSSAVNENGFYWLAILLAPPRPRNNVWIHHHRKVVIDSDNNHYAAADGGPWTRIWDGAKFVQSGAHPVMAFVLDSGNKGAVHDHDRTGQPFVSMAGGQWHAQAETGQVRALNAYKDKTWYEVCVSKDNGRYGIFVAGDFQYGGKQEHFQQYPIDKVYRGKDTPDYFMLGDPHVNFYEGQVFYDDLRLYVPRGRAGSTSPAEG